MYRVGRSSVLRVSAANGKWQTVPAADVKSLINDKGYTILDIRSPTEVSEVGSDLSRVCVARQFLLHSFLVPLGNKS